MVRPPEFFESSGKVPNRPRHANERDALEADAAESPAESPILRDPAAAPRLLIVDDDRVLRETLREIFAPDFTTLAVASGEEAVEAAQEFAVDIAVVDMHMRLLTGIETVRRIKTLYTAAPCILITSDASEQIRREAARVRAYTVLPKPLRLRTLSATVAAAFDAAYPQRRGASG